MLRTHLCRVFDDSYHLLKLNHVKEQIQLSFRSLCSDQVLSETMSTQVVTYELLKDSTRDQSSKTPIHILFDVRNRLRSAGEGKKVKKWLSDQLSKLNDRQN